MKCWIFALTVAAALSACGSSDSAVQEDSQVRTLSRQVEALKAENSRLRTENAELKETPSALLSNVTNLLDNRDISQAEEELEKLSEKFPESVEAKNASILLSKFKQDEEKKSAEASRLAALGFKALNVSAKTSSTESTLHVRSTAISSRWTFDSYGDEWYYKEPEKGQKFITSQVTVSSESKNPKLMGIGAYVADGGQLRRIGTFAYRFARWDDYASYLGNEADYRNDFAHSSDIRFSVAAAVSTDDLKKKPIYLIVTKEGCFSRSYDRFGNPPISYYSSACHSLPLTLTLEDFQEGQLVVARRID